MNRNLTCTAYGKTGASMNCPVSLVAVGSGISLVCFPMEAVGLKDTGICTGECPL